jgi:hypothetical protein
MPRKIFSDLSSAYLYDRTKLPSARRQIRAARFIASNSRL